MKKFIFSAMCIGYALSSFAQKPASGALTSELNLNLNSTSSTISLNSPTGGIKLRYFISDKLAARLSLGLGMNTTRSGVAPTATNLPGGEIENKTNAWALFLGVEKHFGGTDKLSPYFGIELGLGGATNETNWTNYNGAGYTQDYNRKATSGSSGFGVNIVSGADYYVAERLYFGAELGFGFSSFNTKASKVTYSGPAAPTTNPPDVPAAKSSSMAFYPVTGLRLGIVF